MSNYDILQRRLFDSVDAHFSSKIDELVAALSGKLGKPVLGILSNKGILSVHSMQSIAKTQRNYRTPFTFPPTPDMEKEVNHFGEVYFKYLDDKEMIRKYLIKIGNDHSSSMPTSLLHYIDRDFNPSYEMTSEAKFIDTLIMRISSIPLIS